MTAISVKKANSIITKTVGLIGAKTPHPLLLTTRFGIHTFGVRFPLDIVILDKNNTIVRLKKHLLPNRIFFWPPIWFLVLELPDGFIEQKNLTIGEHISLTS